MVAKEHVLFYSDIKAMSAPTNTPAMEHERRFAPVAVTAFPFSLSDLPCALIWQGYLNDTVGTRIRSEYRDKKVSFTRTVKTGEGVSRIEDERTITEGEFDAMQKNVECYLSKERYFADWNGVEVQVNVFTGTLQSYLQIEVEFPTAEAATVFVPPDWFGPEVTHNSLHGNYRLAKDGIPH